MTEEFLAKSRIPGIFFQTLIRGSCLPINGGRIYFSPDQSINQSLYLKSLHGIEVALSIRARDSCLTKWQNVVPGSRLTGKVWVRDLFFTSRFVISPYRLTCVKCKRKLKSCATRRKQQRTKRKKFHFLTFVVLRLSFGLAYEPVTYEQLRNLDYLQ